MKWNSTEVKLHVWVFALDCGHHRYRERDVGVGLTSSPYSSYGTCSYGKFPGYTSQKDLICLNFSDPHPPPSTLHPFHEILTVCGF